MADGSQGFLGRWSRRKQEIAKGKPLDEPVTPSPQPSPASGRGGQPAPAGHSGEGQQTIFKVGDFVSPPLPSAGEGRGEGAVEVPPLPTMQDVQALTAESDFKPFVARGVDPEVRNAAMKKLFTDPHYNVMDRLDIYIDDYSQPDPLPESMLRQMVGAKFLKLFDEGEKNGPAQQAVHDNAGPTAGAPVAELATPSQPAHSLTNPAPTAGPQRTTEDHAHTDLRLQQDHAAGAPGSGRGAE